MTLSLRVCQPGRFSVLAETAPFAPVDQAGQEGTDTLMRQQRLALAHRPKWQRRFSAAVVGLFAWSALLALPAQALAHPSRQKPLGVRSLTPRRDAAHPRQRAMSASVGSASGDTMPWEASVGGTNTGNGNKLTQVPLVGWTGTRRHAHRLHPRPQQPGVHNSELGQKWTHSFDLFLVSVLRSQHRYATIWPSTRQTTWRIAFTQNVDGSYSAPDRHARHAGQEHRRHLHPDQAGSDQVPLHERLLLRHDHRPQRQPDRPHATTPAITSPRSPIRPGGH